MLNGDIFDATAPRLSGVIWDRQLYEFDVFGVPKGDPKKDMAMDFIRYATGSLPLARRGGLGALRPGAAFVLAAGGQESGIEDRRCALFLPTQHFATAFAVDDGWWRAHGPALEARFQAWSWQWPTAN